MVFANLLFLFLFLPINLLLYYSNKSIGVQNAILAFLSLIFYAWGEPVWVFLLIFSASFDYFNAQIIEKYRGNWQSKVAFWASIVGNLSLLVLFKYQSFIFENINTILGTSFKASNYSLPIGISFYTFQTLSYVVDVYKNEVKASSNYVNFLLFVSLFHQLVAGPIVRYAEIEKEITSRTFSWQVFSNGVHRFCIGLFKKVAIANYAGELASGILNVDQFASVTSCWYGILLFSIQLYFDFSGYSDMAIGLGKMFGFTYLENFNYPYISKSATEFWRRWHISLGSFFRDYVYIPLGGKERNPYINLFIVWFLTGLWHGASWNFILWGLYFGMLITFERLFFKKLLDKIPSIFSHIYLIFIVLVGWALFYFTDLHHLNKFFQSALGFTDLPKLDQLTALSIQQNILWLGFSLVLCLPVYHFTLNRLKARPKIQSYFTVSLDFSMLLICISLLVGASYNPFLYFRF